MFPVPIDPIGFAQTAGYFLTFPNDAVYDAADHDVYVTDSFADNVSVVAPNGTLVTTVPIGLSPSALAYSPVTQDVYVAGTSRAASSVSFVEAIGPTNAIVATVTVGRCADVLDFSSATGEMYSLSPCAGNVSVIGTNNALVATIPLLSLIHISEPTRP